MRKVKTLPNFLMEKRESQDNSDFVILSGMLPLNQNCFNAGPPPTAMAQH